MDALLPLLNALNALSPLAVIALLGLVIFMLVKAKASTSQKLETITDNHLHGLPEMAESLARMERTLTALDAFLRAKLNGGPGGHQR